MVVDSDGSEHKSLLTSLGGGQIRHFSTKNSKETEQSTKWDKLEGNLISDFISLERLKEIKEGGFGTIAGLLEGSISLEDLKSIDLKELEIPFIFDFERSLFGGRFEERFYYIHSKEKEYFFKFFLQFKKGSWMFYVGPKGSLNLLFVFLPYFLLKIESGKSHFLYVMAVYFWSRPDYGSNGNRIAIYIPSGECDFEEALDCIMLAFHHTNIPGLIDIMIQFHKNEAGSFEEFFETDHYLNFIKRAPEMEDHLNGCKREIFDIIQDGLGLGDDFHEQHELVARLISWAKDYAEKVTDQF